MPAQFLSPEQIAQYSRYGGEPTTKQLAKYFYLDDADQAVMKTWRGDHTRLGFAILPGANSNEIGCAICGNFDVTWYRRVNGF